MKIKNIPLLHFSQTHCWMNDPNGLIKHGDTYHLYFQSNPNDKNWGDIGWGHAISKDLISWEKVADALYANSETMMFSGSAISSRNTLGLGDEMILFYTACTYEFDKDADFIVKKQTQNIAYSDHNAREWKIFKQNPVLDINSKEFRDPKVIKLGDSSWLMLVSRARDYFIDFYISSDLINWELSSSFSDCTFRAGAWECPDLICLDIDGQTKYVLFLSVDDGFISEGSGVLYIIGNFQNGEFTVDIDLMGGEGYRKLDKGPDFFASQSFYCDDEAEPAILLAWLNNWKYAKGMPNAGLPLLQSIPRELSLTKCHGDEVFLQQKPILAIEQHIKPLFKQQKVFIKPQQPILFEDISGCFVFSASYNILNSADFKLNIRQQSTELFSFHINSSCTCIAIQRAQSSIFKSHTNTFNTSFSPLNENLDIKIVADYYSIEVFVNDYTEVFSFHMGQYFDHVVLELSSLNKPVEMATLMLSTCPIKADCELV